MNKDDLNANIELYFKQIIALADLMIENDNKDVENLITIRELAHNGFETFKIALLNLPEIFENRDCASFLHTAALKIIRI